MVIDSFTIFGSWPGQPDDHPAEQLIEGIQRYKLDRACTLAASGIFLDARVGNAATLAACRRDPHLVPIGTADPRIDGVAQVRACTDNGFKLMALFPESQGWSLDSLVARDVLRAIAASGMTLIIEATRDGAASHILRSLGDAPTPLVLLDINLHLLSEAMAVLRARPATYLTTRLLSGGDTIEYLAQTVGADRLVFSSRFPVSCFSSAFLTAKFALIDDADRGAIMGNNMARLLGLA